VGDTQTTRGGESLRDQDKCPAMQSVCPEPVINLLGGCDRRHSDDDELHGIEPTRRRDISQENIKVIVRMANTYDE
jgi:hypothetical protein